MSRKGIIKGNQQWMTTREVAEMLGWSIRKVQRYAKKGMIPAQRRFGVSCYVFYRKDVRAYLRLLYRKWA